MRRGMRSGDKRAGHRRGSAAAFFLAFALPLGAAARPPCADLPSSGVHNEVVLTVNMDRISRAEIERRMGDALKRMLLERQILVERGQFEGEARERYERMYAEAFREKLREAVMERLLLQWAKQENLKVDPRRLDWYLEEKMRRYAASRSEPAGEVPKKDEAGRFETVRREREDRFGAEVERRAPGAEAPREDPGMRRLLEEYGSIGEARRKAEEEIAIQVMRERLRASAPPPTRRDAIEYYEANRGEFAIPGGCKVRRILIAKTETDPATGMDKFREGALDLAEEIARKAREGADFAELARRYSDEKETRDRGGLLLGRSGDPFVDPAALGRNASAAIARLKEGEVTDAVDLGPAWGVFKLEGKRKPGVAPIEEVYDAICEKLRRIRAEETEREWFRRRLESSLVMDAAGKPVPAGYFFPEREAGGTSKTLGTGSDKEGKHVATPTQ